MLVVGKVELKAQVRFAHAIKIEDESQFRTDDDEIGDITGFLYTIDVLDHTWEASVEYNDGGVEEYYGPEEFEELVRLAHEEKIAEGVAE